MWPEPSLETNPSVISMRSEDSAEKTHSSAGCQHFDSLWFCCRVFPTSASSEMAVPSNPTPVPLCSLWRWKRVFISLEEELPSCWWLCNPQIWLLELFSPQIHKLCLCCLEEGPWKWQKPLCPCSWHVTDADCLPSARCVWVLRVRCARLLSARVSLVLKVAFSMGGWWRYSDSRDQRWVKSPLVWMWPWEGFFLADIYKSAFLLQICLL